MGFVVDNVGNSLLVDTACFPSNLEERCNENSVLGTLFVCVCHVMQGSGLQKLEAINRG